MKITPETKIKDIIDINYELDNNRSGTIISQGIEYIAIPIKRKPKKDFEWYVNNYFDKTPLRDNNSYAYKIQLINNANYNLVPFEIKIGFLKFICDDIFADGVSVAIAEYEQGDWHKELKRVCPKDFLNSIFE